MQKGKFKKTIALTYITIFLFSLFVPFSQIFAQSTSDRLAISAEKLTFKTGNESFIVAKTYNLANKLISFKSSPSEGVILRDCTTGSINSNLISSCLSSFKSTKNGTFTVTASTNYNGTLNSNTITLIVEDKTTTIVCKDPKILNTTKDACINPPIIIKSTTPTCVLPQKLNADKTACIQDTNTTYTPLAQLPGVQKTIQLDKTTSCPFGNYLNTIIKLIIGFAAVLAMVMIVAGGIEYMTSDLISSKEAGKDTIRNAILGLLIALGAYLILNTINPKLLTACLDNLPPATITISPEQKLMILNISGKGNCAVVTDQNSACNSNKLKTSFKGNTSKPSPFNTLSAQASAICKLESNEIVDAPSPNGTGKTKTIDFCKNDGSIFSFGLFQINLLANGSAITNSQGENCGGLFVMGDESPINKNYINRDASAPGGYSYDCKLKDSSVQTRYLNCKNYLLNPTNNAAFAAKLYTQQGWSPWTTYNSCKTKF